ncbi:MAG: sulfotransferase [Cyanobacteria bacterium P01_G01_bin.38]
MDDLPSRLNDTQAKPSMISLLIKAVQVVAIATLSLFLWPLYAVARHIWYRPPNVPHMAQVKRYLQLTWSVQPLDPGLSVQARIWLTLSIIRKLTMTPMRGLAWILDEVLYGRELDAMKIVAPLFVISGGRSGSTQMTRYIEADPSMTAPNLLQSMFPYLWLWRLAPHTLGRIITPEKVRKLAASIMPPKCLERHEFDPFKADTFDGALFSGHLNALSLYLGPDVAAQEFNFASFALRDCAWIERDCVKFIDCMGRKQLLLISDAKADKTCRLFIKGHFLWAATALEHQYPDAIFLTLIRDPAKRLQSGINYMRVNPSDPAMGPPPWRWLSRWLLRTESDYCRIEQAWYSQAGGARRCVVRFADFVSDLKGTMASVYQDCLDRDQLPAHVPHTHLPRERKQYTVNRSLSELGIDAEALRAQLADYVAWCQPQAKPRTKLETKHETKP